jgi:hypothetical protein
MSCCSQPSWFRQLLLVSALGAGALATLLVPPYREIAFEAEDEKPVSSPLSAEGTSHGMTGVDVDLHHLNFVRSMG